MASSIRNLKIDNNTISFDLDAFADKLPAERTVTVCFASIKKDSQYQIIWNGNSSGPIAGASLISTATQSSNSNG